MTNIQNNLMYNQAQNLEEFSIKQKLIVIIPRLMNLIDLMTDAQFDERALSIQRMQMEMFYIEKNKTQDISLRLEKLAIIEQQIADVEEDIENLNTDTMKLDDSAETVFKREHKYS